MSERITIEIETFGAAFEDIDAIASPEVARILRKLADRIDNGEIVSDWLHDINGNRCGGVSVKRVRKPKY